MREHTEKREEKKAIFLVYCLEKRPLLQSEENLNHFTHGILEVSASFLLLPMNDEDLIFTIICTKLMSSKPLLENSPPSTQEIYIIRLGVLEKKMNEKNDHNMDKMTI